MKWWIALAVIGFTVAPAAADAPTTAPDTIDDPAPAMLAPTYLAIGRDLWLRMSLVRRTLDDLTLDPQIRPQANQILDTHLRETQFLVGEIQAGRMPSTRRIAAVPADLREMRQKLLQLIGPDQASLLAEKLRSLRGEARRQIASLRQNLGDVTTSPAEKNSCDTILTDAEAAVEKLPDRDAEGAQYASARQSMTELYAHTHDALAGVLTPQEQSQLGQPFAQMAATGATTQPSGTKS